MFRRFVTGLAVTAAAIGGAIAFTAPATAAPVPTVSATAEGPAYATHHQTAHGPRWSPVSGGTAHFAPNSWAGPT